MKNYISKENQNDTHYHPRFTPDVLHKGGQRKVWLHRPQNARIISASRHPGRSPMPPHVLNSHSEGKAPRKENPFLVTARGATEALPGSQCYRKKFEALSSRTDSLLRTTKGQGNAQVERRLRQRHKCTYT